MTMFGFAGMVLLLGLMSVIVVVVVVVIASATSSKEQREKGREKTPYYKDTTDDYNKSSSKSLLIVYIVLMVGFVFFGVTSISMSGSIKSLENQLNGMNAEYMQTNHQISDLYQKIRELEEVDDYVERFTYEIKEVTSEGEGVLQVKVYMRMLSSDGEVSLVLENSDDEVVITEFISDTMILNVNVNVALGETYNVGIVLHDEDEFIREELTTIRIQNLIYQYRGIELEEDWDQFGFTMMFTVYNNFVLHEMMAFEEVWIEIFEDDQLISTRLLTVPDESSHDYQEFHFDVFMEHELDTHFLIKVTGVDYFGHEYVMFHEGW